MDEARIRGALGTALAGGGCRRTGTILATVLVAGLLLGPVSAEALESYTQAIDPSVSLNAVSCTPDTTVCVVSDGNGNALYSGGVSANAPATWTSWSGPGVSPGRAVSCPSTSLCVLADGHVEEPLERGGLMYYATSLGGTWTEAFNPMYGVAAVSCPATSLCVGGDTAGFVRVATHPRRRSGCRWNSGYSRLPASTA